MFVFAEKKAFGVAVQVIAVGAEVVVDHIENHRQTMAVGRVDQVFELFGRAVGGLRCVKQNPVIAPVTLAGELRQRHQFDSGNTQLDQVFQMLLNLAETAECPDVQFVDHRLIPRSTLPGAVLPPIGEGIDHHAVAVDIARLGAGGRVRHRKLAIDVVAVAGTCGAAGLDHKPAIGLRQQRQGLSIFQFETDEKNASGAHKAKRVCSASSMIAPWGQVSRVRNGIVESLLLFARFFPAL